MHSNKTNQKNIGIVGMGRFGRLLKNILQQDFHIVSYDIDKTADTNLAELEAVGTTDMIFFCVPISKLRSAILDVRPYLQEDTVILDVCSVKEYAIQVMREVLGEKAKILPTHPMFGPDAARNGLSGLPFVFCPTDQSPQTVLKFLSEYLKGRGITVVEMTAEEHDKTTAFSLCLTQFLGRGLLQLELSPSTFDNLPFKNLLKLIEIAQNDTDELFLDLQHKNPYAASMRQEVLKSLQELDTSIG